MAKNRDICVITCNYIIFLGATQERRTAMTEDSESEVCCTLAMAWDSFWYYYTQVALYNIITHLAALM